MYICSRMFALVPFGKVSSHHIEGFGSVLGLSMIAYCQTPRQGRGDSLL